MIEVDLNHQEYATLSDNLNFSKLIEQNVQVQSEEIASTPSTPAIKQKLNFSADSDELMMIEIEKQASQSSKKKKLN